MLIALLAVLGVNLIVIVALVAIVVGRRRWVNRQPGAFTGAIRVTGGDVDGLSPKWTRGSGRWARDVLVWSKAPIMFNNVVMPVNRVSGEHPAPPGVLKRLGDKPVVAEIVCETANIEVATRADDGALVIEAWSKRSTP